MTIIILIAATVLSIAIVAALLPWNQASVLGSPFVYVFRNAGLKSAALVVNVIVLTSALTSGNYFVYACSRYLWSMAKFHQAPKICAKTSKKRRSCGCADHQHALCNGWNHCRICSPGYCLSVPCLLHWRRQYFHVFRHLHLSIQISKRDIWQKAAVCKT